MINFYTKNPITTIARTAGNNNGLTTNGLFAIFTRLSPSYWFNRLMEKPSPGEVTSKWQRSCAANCSSSLGWLRSLLYNVGLPDHLLQLSASHPSVIDTFSTSSETSLNLVARWCFKSLLAFNDHPLHCVHSHPFTCLPLSRLSTS